MPRISDEVRKAKNDMIMMIFASIDLYIGDLMTIHPEETVLEAARIVCNRIARNGADLIEPFKS